MPASATWIWRVGAFGDLHFLPFYSTSVLTILEVTSMEKALPIRRYQSLDDIKADEYRYWQRRPAEERLDAVEELVKTAYALKGWEIEPDVPRLQRPFVRLRVPWR